MIYICILIIISIPQYYCLTNYFRSAITGTFTHAIKQCDDEGGVIATITNEADLLNAQIACDVANGYGCWIGLNRINDGWEWADGTSINPNSYGFDSNTEPTTSVMPWGPSQPNNWLNGNGDDQRCIFFWDGADNLWNDAQCDAIVYPLCMEVNKVPLSQYVTCTIYLHFWFVSIFIHNYMYGLVNNVIYIPDRILAG